MPVKYLQNPFAISVGSVIVAPLDLNKDGNNGFLLFKLVTSFIGRLLRPDIVHFHYACLGTEIFLQELTLSSTLSSNLKTSRAADPQFPHKMLFYLR